MGAVWPWDDSLDALVAAPEQHRLVFENAHVRVLDTRIAPGERTPVHTHCWPASHYVVSWSDFVRRDATGAVLVDPLAFAHDGKQHVIRCVVLASRLAGQSIQPSVGRMSVGLAYVVDDAQVELETLDMRKCLYVAVAEAVIT